MIVSPANEKNKIVFLVIQPTSLCNLNCSYCYVPDRKKSGLISIPILEKTFEKVLSSELADDNFTINWHAGEPLTAGIDFFKQAVALSRIHNTRNLDIKHVLQTNGILIDDEWCQFFRDSKMEARVSIDGPDFIHDQYRKTWAKTGSHALTMKGIKKLQAHKLKVRTICVLTKTSLDFPEAIFDFFESAGVTEVSFNLEEIEGHNKNSSVLDADYLEIKTKYQHFFEVFFDLYTSKKPPFLVQNFTFFYKHVAEFKRNPHYSPIPLESRDRAMITVLKNGDISTYGPELAGGTESDPSRFIVGNMMKIQKIEDIFESEKYLNMKFLIQKGIQNCKESCQYFAVCGGGNPANKYYELGRLDASETEYCKIHRQAFAELMVNKLSVLQERALS